MPGPDRRASGARHRPPLLDPRRPDQIGAYEAALDRLGEAASTDRFTLDDLRDADGSAVMVHAGRDNFANIPTRYTAGGAPGPDAATLATGDAGARVACGVID